MMNSSTRIIGLLLLIVFFLSNFLSVSVSQSCSQQSECGGNDIRYEPCIDGECSECTSDDDCKSKDICKDDGFCGLSDFFEPFTFLDFMASLTIFVGAMIAAGGGLGGGGIFIPCYILILSLTTATAAALSQSTIFGGSLVNLYFNFKEKHPMRTHRPLPDLYTILIFEPMLLGGTIIGVYFNVILPQPITLACLVITLSYAAFRTLRKGVRLWRKESEMLAMATVPELETNNNSNEDNSPNPNPNTNTDTDTNTDVQKKSDDKQMDSIVTGQASPDSTSDNSNNNIEHKDTLIACGYLDKKAYNQTILKNIAALVPFIETEKELKKPLILMLIMWTVVSLFNILKSNVTACSVIYWILDILVFLFLIFLTFILSKRQVQQYQNKLNLGWLACTGDVQWNSYKKAFSYAAIAGIAGILGGLLGIGGGMIVSPLLLELGVLPRVASATSAMAVLVTSSSATLQFLLLEMLSYDYMLFFMSIGICGTYLGQTVVNYCIKRYGRASMVIFAVGTVIGMAVVLMGIKGIVDIANGDSTITFSSIC